MTILRFRFQQLGGHVHVRVFTATMFDGTFAKVGDLVFSEQEWPTVMNRLVSGGYELIVQFKHEDEL
jgi:hypothetical protein